jgi:O-acetyl-ADP-ribose deacetylase (regulator of RNase III)
MSTPMRKRVRFLRDTNQDDWIETIYSGVGLSFAKGYVVDATLPEEMDFDDFDDFKDCVLINCDADDHEGPGPRTTPAPKFPDVCDDDYEKYIGELPNHLEGDLWEYVNPTETNKNNIMPQENLTYLKGDATEPVGDGHKYIIHCCNDLGLWGAGFVLALSNKWEAPEKAYLSLFAEDETPPFLGAFQPVEVETDITVVNIIGQHGVQRIQGIPPIRYEAIRTALKNLRGHILFQSRFPVTSVHMPRMGAGLAGGDWEIIESMVIEELCNHGISVTVYDF